MKRIWIGAGLLALLPALGLWAMLTMVHVHRSVADDLQQAAQTVEQTGLDSAAELAETAESNWKSHRRICAALSDHAPMDAIDAVFAQLDIYRQHEDATAFAAACAHLSQLVEALEEGNKLTWWNLL